MAYHSLDGSTDRIYLFSANSLFLHQAESQPRVLTYLPFGHFHYPLHPSLEQMPTMPDCKNKTCNYMYTGTRESTGTGIDLRQPCLSEACRTCRKYHLSHHILRSFHSSQDINSGFKHTHLYKNSRQTERGATVTKPRDDQLVDEEHETGPRFRRRLKLRFGDRRREYRRLFYGHPEDRLKLTITKEGLLRCRWDKRPRLTVKLRMSGAEQL